MHDETESQKERKPLAATTIKFAVGLVKQIRASAVNEDLNEIYPYIWNDKQLKAPKVRKKDMKRPAITPDIMTGLARMFVKRVRRPSHKVTYPVDLMDVLLPACKVV